MAARRVPIGMVRTHRIPGSLPAVPEMFMPESGLLLGWRRSGRRGLGSGRGGFSRIEGLDADGGFGREGGGRVVFHDLLVVCQRALRSVQQFVDSAEFVECVILVGGVRHLHDRGQGLFRFVQLALRQLRVGHALIDQRN